MGRIMKSGKVVVVLNGRYAGKKAVVIKNHDDGSNDRPYGHALIAGIDRYPQRVTKNMGRKLIKRRTRVKSFVRVLNYNHIMPTRYYAITSNSLCMYIYMYLKEVYVLMKYIFPCCLNCCCGCGFIV